MFRTFGIAAIYVAVVYGAGFAFGTVRTLLAVPVLGAGTAELIEAPILFVVILISARWLVLEYVQDYARWISVGIFALGFLAVLEIVGARYIQGQTVEQYLSNRDVLWDAVYAALLLAFVAMPFIMAHWARRSQN